MLFCKIDEFLSDEWNMQKTNVYVNRASLSPRFYYHQRLAETKFFLEGAAAAEYSWVETVGALSVLFSYQTERLEPPCQPLAEQRATGNE